MADIFQTESRQVDEVHFLDYFIVIARYSKFIVYSTIIISFLTLLILLFVSNKYTSTARLLPPQQNLTLSSQILDSLGINSAGVGSGGGLGGLASSMLGLKSPGDLYVGMLTSNTIIDRIIERFNLRDRYEKNFIEEVRKKLLTNADINVGRDGLISIQVTDWEPKIAAEMANGFGEELNRLQQEMARRDAQNQMNFLGQELAQTKTNLIEAEEALRSFSENKNVIQIDSQAKGILEYIASLRAAIDAREVQIQVLKQQATPYNYDVIRLETELKGLREKLQAAECQIDQTDNVCIATNKLPKLGLEYFRLYRQVKYHETLYQLYLKLFELARIDTARNMLVNTVQFVDYATVPEKKSGPKRATIIFIVGGATFFMMILIAFGWDYFQRVKKLEPESKRFSELEQHTEYWRSMLKKFLPPSWRKK